jgi:hypothetical protein
MESYDSRHSNHSTTSRIAAALSIQKPPLQLDSQCKYGLLARGDADLFMRFPHASYRCVLYLTLQSQSFGPLENFEFHARFQTAQ